MRFTTQLPILHHQTNLLEGKECSTEDGARKTLVEDIDRHIGIAEHNLDVLRKAREKIAREALAGDTECVCGEISTRHCPVHGQGDTE